MNNSKIYIFENTNKIDKYLVRLIKRKKLSQKRMSKQYKERKGDVTASIKKMIKG